MKDVKIKLVGGGNTEFDAVDELGNTERGENGFGSTGVGKFAAEPKIKFLNTVDPPEVVARLNGGVE